MTQLRVADLTIDELKELVREIVTQTIMELLMDPDEGLELREEIRATLQRSIEAVQAGQPTVSLEEVAARLRLN